MTIGRSAPPGTFTAADAVIAEEAGAEAARERSLTLKLMVSARLLRRDFDHHAGNVGITRAQWSTIAAVAGAEGATQRRIASILDIGEAVAGRQIDRLCEEGWLERRPDPHDRRVHRIYLTTAAAPVLEKLTVLGARQERVTFGGLSEQELKTFSKMLDRVLANLSDSLAGERTVAAPAMPMVFASL